MLKAFANCWKVPELRNRIVVTLGLLFVARVGANIPLPGLDPDVLAAIFKRMTTGDNSAAVTTFNLFTGGAMLKGAVFALGVMPYISASIIMQLMGAVVPSLAKLQQEGEIGRQKVAQYSRYLTIIIATVQGLLMLLAMCDPHKAASVFNLGQADAHAFDNLVVINHTVFVSLGLCLLVSGSMIVLWLGEQLTARGIGNGTSILITIGILADIPGALRGFAAQMGSGKIGAGETAHYTWVHAVGMVLLFTAVTCAMVAITQAVRKIPIQYAKRIIGKKIYGGQSSYLPLKLTYAGVMPVIFAGAITTFPPMLLRPLGAMHPMLAFLGDVANYLDHGMAMQGGAHAWVFYGIYSALIFGFSYFWVSMMFKPVQIADELKKASGFVPGVRPGNDTATFLNYVMTRLTLVGSVTLLIIALMPDFFIVKLGFYPRLASFLGGTGGLITVGVVLDTMRQVETMLLQRHYEGFLKKGRIGGIAMPAAPARKVVDFGDSPAVGVLGYACLALFVAGSAAGIYNLFGGR